MPASMRRVVEVAAAQVDMVLIYAVLPSVHSALTILQRVTATDHCGVAKLVVMP